MPAIKVDASELKTLAADARQAPRATEGQARAAVKGASFAVEKKIKIDMPVRFGVARSSWGHWTLDDLLPGADKSLGDPVWRVEDGGLSIIQGSSVPYIEDLNAGSSRQAPAGFLDRAAAKGQIELEAKLGLLDPLSKEYQMRIFEET